MPDTSKSSATTFPSQWRVRGLITWNLLAGLLLMSWVWEPTRLLWDLFDDALFVDLNLRLADAKPWARLWAFLNLRPMDIASGLLMLPFVIRSGFIFPTAKVRAALLTFVALLLLALALRVTFDYGIVKPLEMSRASPSLTVPGSVRLSELFPDWVIPVKDSSVTSFPGDHASIALVWALLLSLFARGWRLLVVWGVTAILLLPRLVAGAHWGSDDFVGGLFVALLSIGWGCYTPYCAKVECALERAITPLRELLVRMPLLRRLRFLN